MPNTIDISPISYTNKDFRAIYEELLNLINDLTDRWDPKSTNESDPGLVLVKLKAFLADKLNYNIDKNILETFPSQVTQRGNAQKLYDILGYGMKYYQSATTTVTMRYNRGNNPGIYSVSGKGTYTIPAFTQLTDTNNSVNYVTERVASIAIESGNQSSVEVPVIEGYLQDFAINGNTTITINNLDSDYRLYFTESMIAQNGIFIYNDEDSSYWRAVDNLESTQLGQRVFKFGVMPVTNTCYIEFPQDAANLFGDGIYIKYIITQGVNGNISINVLNTIANTLNSDDIKKLNSDGTKSNDIADLKEYTLVIQNKNAVSGKNPESLKEAYRNCQKLIDTFNTLVTVQDYQNAIYNSGTVSNVVVSDRTNDINNSYTVINKTLDGERLLPLNEGVKQEGDKFIPNMNAFNIGVYSLINVVNVSDEDSYNRSFQTNQDTILNSQDAISNYKSLQHDYIDTINIPTDKPFILKNLMSLNGKVLTYQKVTSKEAEEIEENIRIHLFNKYQARNIDFGKEIPYEDLIEEIRKSDDRIKSVVLDYPTYRLVYMDSRNGEFEISNDNNIKNQIIVKSILSGVTPYFMFDSGWDLGYFMAPAGKYKVNDPYNTDGYVNTTNEEGSSESPSHSNVAAITTSVKITLSSKGRTTYNLRKNENIFCIGPSYVEKAQLSTCLYYAFLSPDTSTENPKVIQAGSYYTLGEKEYLVATEGIKKESGSSYLDFTQPNSKKYWIYSGSDKSNNVVCPTMDIKATKYNSGYPDKDSNIAVSSSDNLGTSNTITILGENKIQINSNNKTIYSAWSIDNLYNKLFELGNSTVDKLDGDAYYIDDTGNYTQTKPSFIKGYALRRILQNNDLFLYTDEYKYDLILLGSGTEISVESKDFQSLANQFKYNDVPWSMPKVDSNSIMVEGLNSFIEWQRIPLNLSLFTAEKQIISLGEGAKIKNKGNNPLTISNKEVDASALQYKYEGDSGWNSLPSIIGDNNWSGWKTFSRLQLAISPTQGQVLEENQGAILYSLSEDKSYTPQAVLGPGQYITANNIVALPGGYQQNSAVLTKNGTVENTLTIYISGVSKSGHNYITSNSDAIENNLKTNLEKINLKPSVTEFSEYTEIYIKNDGKDAPLNNSIILNLKLSNQFENSLIPLLFVSSEDGCNLRVIEKDTEKDTEKVTEGPSPITSETIVGYQNKYLNYYQFKSDFTTNPTLKLALTGNLREEASVTIYLFNPIKIINENTIINNVPIKNLFNTLAKNYGSINLFDYSHQIDEEDQILDPTDPESLFLPNHPFNRWVITQLDTGRNTDGNPNLNIKVSKQSYQSLTR